MYVRSSFYLFKGHTQTLSGFGLLKRDAQGLFYTTGYFLRRQAGPIRDKNLPALNRITLLFLLLLHELDS